MDRIRHRVTYWKDKYSNQSMLNEELQVKLELDNEKTQAVLHEEIFQLEQKNLDLQDIVEELISSEDIVTYQKVNIQMMYGHVAMNFCLLTVA